MTIKPRTLEAIWNQVFIRGESNRQKELVVQTLARLPWRIRNKALENTLFIIASKNILGEAFDFIVPEKMTFHIVLLNFTRIEKEDNSRIMDCIAHEIAHTVLKHESGTSNPNKEKEADDLSESWGFLRAYESERTTL